MPPPKKNCDNQGETKKPFRPKTLDAMLSGNIEQSEGCDKLQQLHLQSYPEEKAPAKQAPRITTKKFPGGNKSESRPMFSVLKH